MTYKIPYGCNFENYVRKGFYVERICQPKL